MPQTTGTTGPTLDQRRARHAWEAVMSFAKPAESGTRRYGEEAKEYAREAKKLPMRVMAAGLGQALSFLLAKAKEKKTNLRRLHDHLTDWVIKPTAYCCGSRPDSLLESINPGRFQLPPPRYRRNLGLPAMAQSLRRSRRAKRGPDGGLAMDTALPLPATTSQLVARAPISQRHPGLQLDKFIRPAPRQEQQKESLAEVCRATGDDALLQALRTRRETCLDGVAACVGDAQPRVL